MGRAHSSRGGHWSLPVCFAPGSLLCPQQRPGRHALLSSPFYRWGARDPGQGFELGLWLQICLDLPVSVTSYSRLSKGQRQAGAQGDRGRGAAFLWAGFIRTRLEGCTGSGRPGRTRRRFLLSRVGRGDQLAGMVVTAPQPSGWMGSGFSFWWLHRGGAGCMF